MLSITCSDALLFESRKTRTLNIRKIGYIIGGSKPICYEPNADKSFLLLDIFALADAFFNGIDKFIIDIFANSKKRNTIEARLKKLIVGIPYKNVE